MLHARSQILRAARDFFFARDCLEVETPVRVPAPALESHIDAVPSGDAWLRTSPELHMKRLLADGARSIFQIGSCFRAGEHGRQHRVEFTMLEWYRAGWDYRQILDETMALIRHVVTTVTGHTRFVYQGHRVDVGAPWRVMTVSEAFRAAAGWDPVAQFDADRFDLDLVSRLEPSLDAETPSVLIDYPAAAAALARVKGDVAERWELYIGGLELANAFSELTNPVEQRRRFEACARERAERGQAVYPVDEAFLAALRRGMPDAAGVALGIDRLVMLLTDSADIADVRTFS